MYSVDAIPAHAVTAAVCSRHPCQAIFSLLESTFRYAGVYTAVAVMAMLSKTLIYTCIHGHWGTVTA